MENKEMKKTIPGELNDDLLEEVSGGLTIDSGSQDDIMGEEVPAILNPFDGYTQNPL